MKLALRFLRDLIKSEKIIFSVMVLCVVTSSFILHFSYGLYYNYNTLLSEGDASLRTLQPVVHEEKALTKGDFQRFLEALPTETLNSIELIYAVSDLTQLGFDQDHHYFPMRFCIVNGEYFVPVLVRDSWEESDMISGGRYISDAEESAGELVTMIPGWCLEELGAVIPEWDNETMKITDMLGTTIHFLGKEYTVVGLYKSSSIVPLVPFLTVPEELHVTECSFRFSHTITRNAYRDLTDTAASVIPGCLDFPDLPVLDRDTVLFYKNIIGIALLISVLSVMNFSMLYLFMVQRRRRTLAIFRICGAGRDRTTLLCLGECISLTVPLFMLGAGIFYILLNTVFIKVFPYMPDGFTLSVYLILFLLYLAIMLLIMGILIWKNIGNHDHIRQDLAEGRI